MEKIPEEEVTRTQKIKMVAGFGAVALGGAVETLGITSHENYSIYGGLAMVASGAIYAYRQLPESVRRFNSQLFGFPGPKR
jgi:hypothetical protein